MDTFTPIWDRIAAHAGAEFRQKTGRPFTYSLVGKAIVPSTTNRMLARSQFQQAHQRSPLHGPGQLQDLQGPSYLFAILTDPRIATGSGEVLERAPVRVNSKAVPLLESP